ncbi:MAG TPA: hypothetical protein VJG66_04795 [Patescibacteria group bacterium]|nr:hypothetical protein [Patescibacteria group bacterium]
MKNNEDKISFSQEMQLNVRKKRSAFPVEQTDWSRLKRMIMNHAPSFNIWASASSAGFSASLAIYLTWLTVVDEVSYPYKNHLLTFVFVTATIGIMAAIIAWNKKKDETFSKNQILQEMDIMQVSTGEGEEIEELVVSETGTNKFKITRASYGVDGKDIDVAQILNSSIKDGKLDIKASNAIAGDPLPGKVKFLEVEYKNEGKVFSKKYKENDVVTLP